MAIQSAAPRLRAASPTCSLPMLEGFGPTMSISSTKS
jgi:hypothetical protein